MSLFANIFKAADNTTSSSLFSDKSKFRAQGNAEIVAPVHKVGKITKRKSSRGDGTVKDTGPSTSIKKPKTTKPEDTKAGKSGKNSKNSELARKQAEKVKDLASAARRLEADSDSESDEDSDADTGSDISSDDEYAKKAAIRVNPSNKISNAKEEASFSEEEDEEEEEEEKKEEPVLVVGKRDINDPKVLARTIFVGNIPSSAKKKALTTLFQTYGTIESIRFRSVPLKKDVILPRKAAVASGAVDPTRGSAHAYIIFKDIESAQNAVKKQNMKEWLGQHLRVDIAAIASKKSTTGGDKAEKSADVKYDHTRSVFVGNLHLEAKDEELIRFFINGVGAGGEDELEAVRIVRDAHTSIGKGIAYALFKTPAGRRAALGLNGRKLRERPLRITSIKNTNTSGGGRGGGGGGEGGKYKTERGGAPWQGVTATQSGRSRGPTGGKSLTASYSGKGGGGGKSSTRQGGKRPSVIARKQKQRGLPVTAGVRNAHRASMGGTGKSPADRN
jgi:nucleolar protein 12